MAQGKYYKQMLEQNLSYEYSVVRYSDTDTCSAIYMKGTQEACEKYAYEEGTQEYPLWVEHLESGYRKQIEPRTRDHYVVQRSNPSNVIFAGTLEECNQAVMTWITERIDGICEVWPKDWFDLNALA